MDRSRRNVTKNGCWIRYKVIRWTSDPPGALLLIAGFIDLIPSKAILVFIMLFQQIWPDVSFVDESAFHGQTKASGFRTDSNCAATAPRNFSPADVSPAHEEWSQVWTKFTRIQRQVRSAAAAAAADKSYANIQPERELKCATSARPDERRRFG